MKHTIILDLKFGSTWKLFCLTIITYCVYPAHFIKAKTSIINAHCDASDRISGSFVKFIIAVAYLSLALFITSYFVEETHSIVGFSNFTNFVGSVNFMIWGFQARYRMNKILSSEMAEKEWFHGLWTFLFSPLYFNYQVNKLKATLAQP